MFPLDSRSLFRKDDPERRNLLRSILCSALNVTGRSGRGWKGGIKMVGQE